MRADLDALPGHELVRTGLDDLRGGRESVEAVLLLAARTRLHHAGIEVPDHPLDVPAGHRLYDLLSDENRATAHSRYNALVGRLVSFLRAAGHASPR